jgi:hypothetical protein
MKASKMNRHNPMWFFFWGFHITSWICLFLNSTLLQLILNKTESEQMTWGFKMCSKIHLSSEFCVILNMMGLWDLNMMGLLLLSAGR